MENLSEHFKYWFSGFFDGEGYFNSHKTTKYYKKKKYQNTSFEIGIILAQQDKDILEKIQKFFNCGYIRSKKPSNQFVNSQLQYSWRVYRQNDIEKFIQFFDKYSLLTPNKKAKFEKFKKDFYNYNNRD